MPFDKTPFAPGITSYSNVIPDPQAFISTVESLVEAKKLKWTPGQVGNAKETSTEFYSHVNTDIRVVDVIGLLPFDRGATSTDQHNLELHLTLNNMLLPIIDDYTQAHKLPKLFGENWQILRYGAGHHFKDHIDDSKKYPRTCSISFYLNDDYEGGEIEFPRFGLKIKPIANQAIIFPANYVYNHAVHPVTSGVRWTIVNWFE